MVARKLFGDVARRFVCVSFALVLLVLGNWAHASSGPEEGKRALTIDDLLRQEGWGRSLIDPAGRWLVFERGPRYDELPDYGMDWLESYGQRSFGHVQIVDLRAPGTPRPLFAPEPGALYRLLAFSPDGNLLAMACINRENISVQIINMQTHERRSFNQPPDLARYESTFRWISPTEFAYASLPSAGRPAPFRRAIGKEMYSAWSRTWEGAEPSVSEIASHANGRVAVGGDPPHQGASLIGADFATGQTRRLVSGRFIDLAVSPDSAFLSALKPVEYLQRTGIEPDAQSTKYELVLIDLSSGRERTRGAAINPIPGTVSWSSNSKKVAYFTRPPGDGAEELRVLDVRTTRTTATRLRGIEILRTGYYNRPDQRPFAPQWIGQRLLLFARDRRSSVHRTAPRGDWLMLNDDGRWRNLTGRFDSVSPSPVPLRLGALGLLLDNDVWRVRANGDLAALTTERAINAERVLSLPESDETLIERKSQGASSLILAGTLDGRQAIVTAPSEHARLVAASSSARAAVYYETGDTGSTIWLARDGRAPLVVDRVNLHLANVAPLEWRTVDYMVDGASVSSRIILPYGFESGRRYPVIVQIYPGTRLQQKLSTGESFGFYAPQLFAAHGYIVLFVSNPYRPGGNEDFLRSMVRHTLAGVDAIVEQGYGDPVRISLFGFSQGGLPALWLTTQTERFRAIVSVNGWADPASHYFEGSSPLQVFGDAIADTHRDGSAYYNGSVFSISTMPWENPAAYYVNSPLYLADRIRTPVMLVHSDFDGFSGAQYERMFTALFLLGREARLVRYWGEGHGPTSPPNIRDVWSRMLRWYDHHSRIVRKPEGFEASGVN